MRFTALPDRLPRFQGDGRAGDRQDGRVGLHLQRVAGADLQHGRQRREARRELEAPVVGAQHGDGAVGDDRVRRQGVDDLDLQREGELVEDQVGREPGLGVARPVQVREAEDEAQPRARRPLERRQIAAAELGIGQWRAGTARAGCAPSRRSAPTRSPAGR